MLNRSIAPPFFKNFSLELPRPEIFKLSESCSYVHLSGIHQDIFKIEVVFKAGKWYEPKPGISHFASHLLDKGTSNKTSNEIAEILDYYGSQFEVSSGYDFVSASVYGLKNHFEKIASLFLELLTDSIFRDEELHLQKQIFLQNLEISNKKNSIIASKAIRKNIFGATHPYGNSIEQENVTDLKTDDLKKYFNSNFNPYEIYSIGNFNDQQNQWLINEFGSLTKSETLVNKTHEAVKGGTIERIPKTDSIQSSIRFGKSIINRDHADYFSLLLLNHVLGGYFGSRLMKNIREEKGLTYGIYSSLSPFKNGCMFSIGADVNKENLKLTVDEIRKEVLNLTVKSIDESELDIAKSHLLGSLQLEIANPFSTLDKIKNIRLNDLDGLYYKNLFAKVNSATPRELREMAEKYFQTIDLLEVTVG
jgi:zinc protease